RLRCGQACPDRTRCRLGGPAAADALGALECVCFPGLLARLAHFGNGRLDCRLGKVRCASLVGETLGGLQHRGGCQRKLRARGVGRGFGVCVARTRRHQARSR
ncbi:hypothetical protein OXX80_014316, partial [Metschnikowia pulcherrima]